MGKSSGCVLILAGLAVAAYAYYAEPQAASQITAAQGAPAGAGDGAAPATKVPGGSDPATAPAPQPASKPAADASAGDRSGKGGPPVPAAVPPTQLVPPAPVPAKRPRTAVAAVQVGETPPRVPVGETKTAAPPLDRAALTREIQRHLKRVGCYRGDVTGVWSQSVRQAMRTFTERVNAALPVDEPDPVLLAMVQSHAPGACSAACPQGEDRAANGRCVPSALVASAMAKGGVKAARASAEAAKKRPGAGAVAGSVPPGAPALSSPDGRMALAGPPVAGAPQAKAPRRQPKVAGWSRSVQGRPRDRRAHRPTYQGYSGVPSWAVPFLMPFGQ
jgi:hypothetical protein